jgi:hypothetical protein
MVFVLGVADGAHAARATGTADHVGWSLDGRHLTLTLTKPLKAPRTPARVSCGDDASYEPGVFTPSRFGLTSSAPALASGATSAASA